MKVFLMYPERDFDVEAPLPCNAETLIQDLELTTLFDAMGPDDDFLQSVAKTALLTSLTDPEPIVYRQEILADCEQHADVISDIYRITIDAVDKEKHSFHFGRNRADSLVHQSVEVLTMFAELLKQLRHIADQQAAGFRSAGFIRFFSMLKTELDDAYLATIDRYLEELGLRHGVLSSAELGRGNKGMGYRLRQLPDYRRGRFAWLLSRQPDSYGFTLADRDQSGARALDELRNRGLNPTAEAVAQSVDHILAFFKVLRTELAFYLGGMNLRQALEDKKTPICAPVPKPTAARCHVCSGLVDVCLALTIDRPAVGNDLAADGTNLIFVTGANQGGKSTFLRSIGLAQLMMQCGLFVPAKSFSANICSGVFTHYKREEDRRMDSGKFEEELLRMSDIVDEIAPNALVLFNESFSSTNEREGSDIAGQIVEALLDRHIQIVFVTHFYELASAFHETARPNAVFLRADREDGGARTFKLVPGKPLPTSYGEDLYDKIFGERREARNKITDTEDI